MEKIGLSSTQILICTNILDELLSRSISRMFAFPVDPSRDNCPNYSTIVPNPMDLGTVKKKLSSNEYNKISEWKNDMELIWANSLLYNKSNSILLIITVEMQDLYRKLTKYLSDDRIMDWSNKLAYLREQLFFVTKPYENNILLLKKSNSSPKIHSSKTNKNPKSPKQKKKPNPKKILSQNAILRLTKQINSLTDENQIMSVLDIIEEEEPHVKIEGDLFELDVGSLKPSTLIALRNKMSQMFPLINTN